MEKEKIVNLENIDDYEYIPSDDITDNQTENQNESQDSLLYVLFGLGLSLAFLIILS